MKRVTITLAALLLALVMVLSTACQAAPSGGAPAPAPEGGKPSAPSAGGYLGDTRVAVNPDIQNDGVNRLGVAFSAVKYSAIQMLYRYYETQHKNFGFDDFIGLSADSDLETQINQIQDLINQKCDVIIVNSVDSQGIAPVCQRAMEAGIAVMAVDRKIGTGIYYTLETDNVSAGRDVAMTVADRTFYPGIADGAVKVMYVIGDMASSAQHDRLEGLKQTLEYYPWIKVVATPSALELSKVYDAVVDAFTSDPDIKAVFVTGGDDSVTPVVSALRELGKLYPVDDPNYVYIGSVDGAPNALEAIKNGESSFTANQRFDLFGTQIMAVAKDYLEGKYVSSTANNVQLSCSMVMRENLARLEQLGVLWGLKDEIS